MCSAPIRLAEATLGTSGLVRRRAGTVTGASHSPLPRHRAVICHTEQQTAPTLTDICAALRRSARKVRLGREGRIQFNMRRLSLN